MQGCGSADGAGLHSAAGTMHPFNQRQPACYLSERLRNTWKTYRASFYCHYKFRYNPIVTYHVADQATL